MNSLLLVEDNSMIGQEIKAFLTKHGFQVDLAKNFAEGRAGSDRDYDLAILDLNLPDGNGFDLLELFLQNNIKVIITTVVNDVDFIAKALDAGASDYLTKPFNLNILRARIAACLRDFGPMEMDSDLVLKEDQGIICYQGQVVSLTALEYRLLAHFIRHRGQLLTRDQLLARFWDARQAYVNDNTLTATIKRIRDKTSKDLIETVRGIGYRLKL
ncbi:MULTISPECIES: response regulator transcription factor [Aerococcus]|uniref:response regulator transcription factor n=1 Tax=Aerococcus urinae (strain CCUG 59500 / ACS-120-V-Col10a) TaxID=2976812 RepID=UPI000200E7F1|nr:response regulator transcription factor [Aerococcus sp. Group 1]AEA00750.1 response regulator receiver domain protein [Aerococcus sp. Group 1]MCY3030354.1 response regulator transcription factor [Aerococcus sp. Group 1]MCY3055451.1 response regulator transcription factor [Aerococcus sp. Group 1]MCY3057181.1 response regulator transcription factor [Aerococcus sp. Group 1]MCY3061794.1 response regulator transcription factor [Aerococcus sp. Group 1]